MLVSPTTFWILRGIAGILLFAVCYYLIKERMEVRKKTVISIIVGVTGFTAVQFGFSKIYIIDRDLFYEAFYLIGSRKQQMGNGKTIRLSAGDYNRVTVINQSRFKLVLEEIIYTDNINSVSSDGDFVILPHAKSEVFLPGNEITYFFNDNIPDAVEIKGSSVRHYWLRLESQADNDDSADEYE